MRANDNLDAYSSLYLLRTMTVSTICCNWYVCGFTIKGILAVLGKLKMEKIVSTILCLTIIGLQFISSNAQAANYSVEKRFHQSAATNREEADITVIRCSNGNRYYIYGYYRNSGPRYRAIIPPYWGNPIGGGDHHRFEEAVNASCYQ